MMKLDCPKASPRTSELHLCVKDQARAAKILCMCINRDTQYLHDYSFRTVFVLP